jgi:hypothetical protein
MDTRRILQCGGSMLPNTTPGSSDIRKTVEQKIGKYRLKKLTIKDK